MHSVESTLGDIDFVSSHYFYYIKPRQVNFNSISKEKGYKIKR